MGFDRRNLIFLGIFTAFFGFLLMAGEPVYVNDTFQYENQMVMREPGYALLIQFFRFLSPEGHYRLLVLFQNILAVLANTAVLAFLRRRFQLRMPISFLFAAILLAPHVMTPVFASTHLILTNALMTEGVLFSLYPLAMMSLLDMLWSQKAAGRESMRTIGLFFLLSLIRGQMMVLFVVWFLAAFALSVKSGMKGRTGAFELADNRLKNQRFFNRQICSEAQIRRIWQEWGISIRRFIAVVAVFVLAFTGRSLVVHVYNYCEQGLFVDTASGKAMSFANVLYTADREDGEAIEDEALRALFYEMYDAADADRMNYKYADVGILNRAAYHELCHDELNFTYFGEPAKRYVGETQGIFTDRYQELMIAVDEVAAQLSSELMPQAFGRYVHNYIAVIILGFIRTVAYGQPVLVWYALLVYLAAIALTVILWNRKHDSMAAPFMAAILLTIMGNVCATALMIQCISRYMIYNLPLFYIAGLLELVEIYRLRKE